MIPYGRQNISQEDVDAVISVLNSDFLTQGPEVPKFENKICSITGSKYALAVNSATSALHLSCLALGLKEHEWLWTTPISFAASSNCALYCGAKVDFVDIDPLTYNLCPIKLEEKLIQAEKENRLPKIVVPVHLSGQSCKMEEIARLSRKYGFSIIEDASHAIGGHYQSAPIGKCEYSDITVFSFHPVKIVTTAEGGIACTNNEMLAKRIELLRSHGITRDPNAMTEASKGDWYYQQIDLGFNYRMTDLQAALGTSQLARLKENISARHQIANIYNKTLIHLPLLTPHQTKNAYSAFHLYIIRLDPARCNRSRDEVFNELRAGGIGVNLHYIPIYRHPYYSKFGYDPKDFPNAEAYYSEAISLPIFPTLGQENQNVVIKAIAKALE